MKVGLVGAFCGASIAIVSALVAFTNDNEDAGWGVIIGCVVVYGGICEYFFTREWARKLVIGFSAHNPHNQDPVSLPRAVAIWSVASACLLAVWHVFQKSDTTISRSSFFSVGWRTNLTVVGAPVDRWWLYLAIVIYQVTRGVFGSLVKNIFTPHYSHMATYPQKMDAERRDRLLAGQALVSVFLWWSALTDVLLSAAQIDLAACTLLVTMAADYSQALYKINEVNEAVELPFQHEPTTRHRQLALLSITEKMS